MIRKAPLRTYSKKNTLQPYVRTYKEPIFDETSIKLRSPTEDSKEDENIDNSLAYDPFDTTFDRLLKNTRTQAQPLQTSENKNACTTNSSYAGSSDDTDAELPLPSIIHNTENSYSKPAGRDGLRSRNKKESQKKAHTGKLIKTHHKVVNKKEKKPKDTKQNSKKQKKDKTSTNNIVSGDIKDVGVQDEKIQITDCYIKLTQLSIEEYSSGKKSNAMTSSTPVGRLRKSAMYNISFSPIDGNSVKEYETMKPSGSKYRRTTCCNKDIEPVSKSVTKGDISNDKNLSEFKNSREEKNNVLCIPSVLVNSSPSNVLKEGNYSPQTSVENIVYAIPTNSNDAAQSNPKDQGSETSNIDADTPKGMLHNGPTCVKHTLSITDASRSLFDDTRHSNINCNNSQDQNENTGEHSSNGLHMDSLTSDADSNKSYSLFGSCNENSQYDQQQTPSSSHECNELDGSDAVLHSIKNSEESDTDNDAKEHKTEDTLDNIHSAITQSLIVEPNEKAKHTELQDLEKSCVSEKSVNARNEKLPVPENFESSQNNTSYNKTLKQCTVLLTRLEDPVAVTERRKRYRNWDLQLTNILEDQDETVKPQKTHRSSVRNSVNNNSNKDVSVKVPTSLETEDITDENEYSLQIEDRSISEPARTLYLKPGKSWARSLSILNNIQSGANLNKLSIGKGKKWRHSVRDILDMQNQGTIQCCVKKQDTDKELASNYELINRQSAPVCYIFTERKSYNPNRFSRRISVRVVPDNNRKKSDDNAAFLVACNITPTDNRESLTQQARECSVYNLTNDVTILAEANAKKIVLGQCYQENYIPFTNCFPEEYLEHCRKIGEGVYGEVFLYDTEEQKSVIKIIPIEGSELVNGEPQKKFNEILSEIVIAKELHNLRFNEIYNTCGFVEVKNIRCIIGKYPERLIELWKNYDEEKNSDNDCPVMFNENQLYIALELGHAGQDLEAFVFLTAEEAYSSFIQTALALAVAEKSLEFEHRDLHWGNILIARTDEQHVLYKFDDKEILLPTKGVKVSIIDFTLSRVSYQGCYIYNDLALDPALFTAQGEYQFEIYRLMREKTQNNWQKFEPYTNILWLHYTLDKMITAVRYKKKTMKIHKSAILKLKELKDDILSYDSASDFIVNCDKLSDVLYNSASVRDTRTRKVNANK